MNLHTKRFANLTRFDRFLWFDIPQRRLDAFITQLSKPFNLLGGDRSNDLGAVKFRLEGLFYISGGSLKIIDIQGKRRGAGGKSARAHKVTTGQFTYHSLFLSREDKRDVK